MIGIFVAALLASAGWCVASSFRRAARANVGRRAGIPVRSRSTIAPERRRRLIGTYAGALGILAALLVLGPVAAVVGALGVVLVPRFMRRRRARAGQSMVESQLAAAVSGVAAALRAGLSLSQSIRFAAAEAEPPVAESLLAVAHREELGVPLEESIARWSDGAASADVRLVADVLRLHVGAGLPRVLDHVCRALRERGIDPDMEVDDLTFVGFADAHIVHIADHAALGSNLRECQLHRAHALRRCLAAGSLRRLQRFDVGLDLNGGPELLAERSFQLVGDVVR